VAKELERLATVAGKWNELIGQYTQVVQGINEPKQAADLWVKIARWYDSALNHVEYGIASAQQALALEPAHVGALTALEDFYRKQSRWRELVAVLARHAEVETEAEKKVEILLALADAQETQLGDAAQATAAYEQALVTDERSMDAINALERLYRRMQAWDRLVDVLQKKSHIVDDGELAVKLRLQVGELWEERLGDNNRAVEAYNEVLTVDPQNLPALKALERLYEKTGNMDAYLDVIEHQLEVTSEHEDRVSLYQRMAQVREEQGNNERAIDNLQKISSSTTATRRPTAISSGSTAPSATGTPWSRTTGATSWWPPTPTSGPSSTRPWGTSMKRSYTTPSGPSRPSGTCSPSTPTTSTPSPAWRASTSRPSSGSAPSR
jgi:tetratricopeptide (TPR) repeat protein